MNIALASKMELAKAANPLYVTGIDGRLHRANLLGRPVCGLDPHTEQKIFNGPQCVECNATGKTAIQLLGSDY